MFVFLLDTAFYSSNVPNQSTESSKQFTPQIKATVISFAQGPSYDITTYIWELTCKE